jgi:hypothetical protein
LDSRAIDGPETYKADIVTLINQQISIESAEHCCPAYFNNNCNKSAAATIITAEETLIGGSLTGPDLSSRERWPRKKSSTTYTSAHRTSGLS